MQIELTLEVEDDSDVDSDHEMGITNDAYDRLYEAITNEGFSFVDGPTRVLG